MRSRNLDLPARVLGVVALLIAACCGSPPALAKVTMNTVATLTNIYTPTIMGSPSTYVQERQDDRRSGMRLRDNPHTAHIC